MRKDLFAKLPSVLSLLLCSVVGYAQSTDVPRFELGAEFTSIRREDFGGGRNETGLGGRFTYNIHRSVALEAAGYVFPNRCFICADNGRMSEALFGVKAGKRFEKWGLFAKARPGLVSFSRGHTDIIPLTTPEAFPFSFEVKRANHFAFDLGAVLEFYPSKRIVTRFDAGDTLVHYGRRTINFFVFDPADAGGIQLGSFTRPARTRHNFQFSAGIGFRF